MKILFLDWKCFHREDTIEALKNMGHVVVPFFKEGYNDLKNEKFSTAFKGAIEKNAPDLVFSYNYFPIVAEGCKEMAVPYVSFIYDSPYVYLYSYTLMYPTNHVFLFDSGWVREFNMGGLTNVHYMVLPGNPQKIASMDSVPGACRDKSRTVSDVSFVGALYNEQHNFYERLEAKGSPYLMGYLSGIIEAQQKLYGMDIVDPALTPEILKLLDEAMPLGENLQAVEPKGYRYSNYFIKRKITQLERIRLLSAIGETFGSEYNIKLFTLDPEFKIKGVKNMGVSPYETEMPYVFNDSRINLNISLRSIVDGIPLRCMDIMSCGGFLLSNYQTDLLNSFIPGEDFDFFGDKSEMLDKIEYYLTHEKERAEIAENGRRKVGDYYSFEAVFKRIFDTVFGENHE